MLVRVNNIIFMNISEIIQISAIALSAIGIIIAISGNKSQLKIFNRQLKLNFFSEYTRRYQELVLDFPEYINDSNFEYETLGEEEKGKIIGHMRAYFNLCSEEFHLYKDNCLDKNVWGVWEKGITHTMAKKAFIDSWYIVNKNYIFDDDFERWMKSKIETSIQIKSIPKS